MDDHISALRKQIAATESKLQSLRQQLANAELDQVRQLQQAVNGGFPAEWIQETLSALDNMSSPELASDSMSNHDSMDGITNITNTQPHNPRPSRWPLTAEEYKRYGRQMIMPEIGLHGQLRLKNAKVLIVGVGGLGCPAAAYLAGAGVGTLGLMDGDTVELSNLHRQIAHSASRVGRSKVDSAYEYLYEYVADTKSIIININLNSDLKVITSLNPLPIYNLHPQHLAPSTALQIFLQYDLVLDCTDHPTSRYLISDTCVLAGKPLVSASALRTEGQLIVLNSPPAPQGDPSGGPCYRCVWPKPPPADSVLSCGEGGVLGPVVGVMGVLQALESIKLLASPPAKKIRDELDELMSELTPPPPPPNPTLLIFSTFSPQPFRTIRMRRRHATCAACSSVSTITPHSLTSGSMDYAAFCGLTRPVNVLSPDQRVAARDFARLPRDGSNVLIDVRDEVQYQMCALRGSINVPWTGDGKSWVERAFESGAFGQDAGRGGSSDYYVVCRFGNDSQMAANAIEESFADGGMGGGIRVKDIRGGFRAWREEVDPEWPDY
jgi:adenylyltransferase/sulfurtransferase